MAQDGTFLRDLKQKMVFSAKAARTGGIVRRSIRWVEREIGVDEFQEDVQRRGFHLLKTRTQFIVVCNQDPIRMIC
ncbi:N-(5'-phosphoribosyl)anthranilate isomerase [Palleronia caenipelagi]|uniref:N-(5'-phosphoribosyl)anthranilate isomerase n=1 Tax=Palleronia caenipelagi TaxID=2489174 RepID=A0A547Q9B2_9RHOB|nr:N-(5'-phosphoribosyl)anthranilate isomerase [Palleronia caenipelagi]TRD22966.1 N-(5'-phosphoribosyl)anthranilate isomerase [Palleronia caenipelagi]